MSDVRRIGLLGFGAAGTAIGNAWMHSPIDGYELSAVCARASQFATVATTMGSGLTITDHVEDLLHLDLDIIVEAAGQASVATYGAAILGHGCDFYVLSVGALAEDATYYALRSATIGGGRMFLPSGALAGFDGLRSLAVAGLTMVKYTSTKPPSAWASTPAAKTHQLESLTHPTVVFSGNAREAAKQFPKNANLAASVALAGIGFDRTIVELVADPAASENTGYIHATSELGELHVTLAGIANRHNPKTSEITSRSVLASLENSRSAFCFL